MEAFLKSVERSAYRMALMACRDREDALDLVQDAMCRFVDRYAGKPAEEWKPLFYKVLHNRVTDHLRRKTVRDRLRGWFGLDDGNSGAPEDFEDTGSPDPEHRARVGAASAALQRALEELPLRQRQAFLLRSREELGVEETARIMGCSAGSVKTHCSRAVQALREKLGEHWP